MPVDRGSGTETAYLRNMICNCWIHTYNEHDKIWS